jgi:hypothetical protein
LIAVGLGVDIVAAQTGSQFDRLGGLTVHDYDTH